MPSPAARDASNDATDYLFFDDRDALVLSGGGARGAYQVGVLKAIAEWLPEDAPCPFEVLVGTSAGALNAAAIGARAHSLREAVQSLEEVWSNFRVEQVVQCQFADHAQVRPALDGLAAFRRLDRDSRRVRCSTRRHCTNCSRASCPWSRSRRRSRLDGCMRSPSRRRVTPPGRRWRFSTASTRSTSWNRVSRAGRRRQIDLDVLMASAAIPFIFPAWSIDGITTATARCASWHR